MRTLSLLLVATSVLAAEVAKADFTFGGPVNLGPVVNSPTLDGTPSVTADGLSLLFNSQRAGGYGHYDVWVCTRETTSDPWGEPTNPGPPINTSSLDGNTVISPDGLTLYFTSNRPGGHGGWDIYMATRSSVSDPWGAPENLGPPFNTSASEHGVTIAANGLELFFGSSKPGGFGAGDIYVSRRATTEDAWGEPVNLGPVVNGPSADGAVGVSSDGLLLFFHSNRPGGHGRFDVWMTRRATPDDDWGVPLNLGPTINTSAFDGAPAPSPDGSTLHFMSGRPDGVGSHDLWQASIIPIVDFDADGETSLVDLVMLIDAWGTNDALCDIGPMPWGDGQVDIEDLKVFMAHWEKKNMQNAP